jgi:S-adenosylmethionine:tRNA ribosyltransferase-isomerase
LFQYLPTHWRQVILKKWQKLPLPPYIQKARKERHNVASDESWYQTAWAKKEGSFAAPTASLHFSEADLQTLRDRGVFVLKITSACGLRDFSARESG